VVTGQPASLAAALVALQAQLPDLDIRKEDKAQVGTRETSYANLHTITSIIFPVLTALGLYWTCIPTMADGQFVLRYILGHQPSGETITGDYPIPSTNPQTMGGAITYARRYALCAVLGIAPADDDDDADITAAWNPPANPRTRKADRHRADRDGPLPDDQWTTSPPAEARPGSSSADQRQIIGRLMAELGTTTQSGRHAMAMDLLNRTEPVSSTALSYQDAADLIAALRAKKAEVSS
jgi:hypothetical protein